MRYCQQLQGRVIAIELTDLEKTIYCHPGSWGLRLSLHAPPKPVDATLRSRVFGLINLLSAQTNIDSQNGQHVEILGNIPVAQKFQKILTELDIDWQHKLAEMGGDQMVDRIDQGFRDTQQWVSESLRAFTSSSSHCLHENTHLLIDKDHFSVFKQDVTNLRQQVDRLEDLLEFNLAKKDA
ncbi:MAG: hypothetical protein GY763_10655, partial [Gammaproteobacteria bacterium]|nr:hypothetical protein [Gammaproteobacteria bacterium]